MALCIVRKCCKCCKWKNRHKIIEDELQEVILRDGEGGGEGDALLSKGGKACLESFWG